MIGATLRWAMLGLGVMFCSTSAFASGPDPVGDWARDDGTTKMSIAPCGQKLCAKNTWVKDPNGDEKLGDVLEMTLEPKSATVFAGEAFDQRRDMTYSMKLSMTGSKMQTQGCVLLGIICKTADWTRVQ